MDLCKRQKCTRYAPPGEQLCVVCLGTTRRRAKKLLAKRQSMVDCHMCGKRRCTPERRICQPCANKSRGGVGLLRASEALVPDFETRRALWRMVRKLIKRHTKQKIILCRDWLDDPFLMFAHLVLIGAPRKVIPENRFEAMGPTNIVPIPVYKVNSKQLVPNDKLRKRLWNIVDKIRLSTQGTNAIIDPTWRASRPSFFYHLTTLTDYARRDHRLRLKRISDGYVPGNLEFVKREGERLPKSPRKLCPNLIRLYEAQSRYGAMFERIININELLDNPATEDPTILAAREEQRDTRANKAFMNYLARRGRARK